MTARQPSVPPSVVRLAPKEPCRVFVDALLRRLPGQAILVSPSDTTDNDVSDALWQAATAPLAASVSPLGLVEAGRLQTIKTSGLPPASLARPSALLVLLLPDGLESFTHNFDPNDCWEDALAKWADDARKRGWRHVASPALVAPQNDVHNSLTAELEGPANELLSTLKLWARTRLRPPAVVVDGACLKPGSEATGTFQVVMELTRELARYRPECCVSLAVPESAKETIGNRLASTTNVRVIPRNYAQHFDLMYRPYQFLRPEEIEWTMRCASRVVLGQLDMIGFSNDAYHPRADMFHTARNMQRATLRAADRVVVISHFAAATLLAECPDLDQRRLAIVPCGTDHVSPFPPSRPSNLPADVVEFIACISATFWHKNRIHAIRTFLRLRNDGYEGHLIIAGPEPFFGRSTEEEDLLLDSLGAADRDAIHRIGMVDEPGKWWLLANADSVLYPSITEGFGLVPFEAASVGTPALSGRTASLPEALGSEVRFAESWQPSAWADVLQAWIDDPHKKQHQVDAIRRRSAELTWRHAAEQTWKEFEMAFSEPRRFPTAYEGDRWGQLSRHQIGLTPLSKAARFARRVDAFARRKARRAG